MGDRIDVHQHVLPPSWVEGMREPAHNFPSYPVPPWSPDSAMAFMDRQNIAAGIVSLTTPGVIGWEPTARRAEARRCNEYVAELAVAHPGRFGSFATLPLPDFEGALLETAYALDELGADGVTLYSNYEGVYLGDPSFEPLWAALDSRDAVVFIHPSVLPLKELAGTPAPFVDFPFDTTRTANDIVLKGVFDRYKRVKVILSHGGGFLPYAVYRLAGCAGNFRPGIPSQEALLANFRRFYFDTALSSSPAALPSLLAFADPSHILFGSDYPYAPGALADQFTGMLDSSPLLTAEARVEVDRSNARALLSRWAA